MTESSSILVVDDDPQVRDMLSEYLGSHGYQVAVADGGPAMRAALEDTVPALVLLDIAMPGEDGLSLARYLREHFDLGIIMVTASGEVVDRIVGLEIGADDYVAKPFDPRELLARVKSVMRRANRVAKAKSTDGAKEGERSRIRLGHCELDLDTRQLLDGEGREIAITSMEFDLLQVFSSRPNRVLSRDQILNLTQNRDWDPFDRSVDIRIARLRRKIEPDPAHPRLIRTVRGAGYMFVPGAD